MIDHQQIVEEGWVELYRRGQLAPEVEERFEEHFLTCPECQQDLELARGFQRGLQAMAAEEVALVAVGAGFAAFFARRARLLVGALALLAVVGLGSALWVSLDRSRDLESRAAELASELDERELARRKLIEELARGRERSAAERQELLERIRALESSPGLSQPTLLSSVFLLAVVRGQEAEPAATIDLARVGEVVTLAVPIDLDPSISRYRLRLLDPAGRPLVDQRDLLPNPLETLLLVVPKASLGAGDYQLVLEGQGAARPAAPLARYPVRVIERPR